MDFAHDGHLMVREQPRRPSLHECFALHLGHCTSVSVSRECDRPRFGQRGRGLSFRYPPTERGVSGMGCGTQGCSLSLFPAVGTLGLCPVRARAKPGALSLCNPSLCPSDDGKDHGHLVALPVAPAGLLAIAKARRLRTIEGVASVLTDARPTRSRKDPSHSAGGGGRLDDFVCASQRRRADHRNAVCSYVAYLGKTIWPSRLAVFYPHPENSLPWSKILLATVILAGISGIVLRFREKRYLAVGWLWYLVALAPMIGIVQSGRQGMADRYACLSLLGLALGGVWLLGDWAARFQLSQGLKVALSVILMSPYVYLTRVQIGYWHDSYTLFTRALEVTKNNGIAENNLGIALVEMGEVPLAKGHFETAVRLIPELASAHYNLAVILQSENQPEDSARQYQLAIALSVDQIEKAQSHNNLGALFLQSSNFAAAKTEFNAAIEFNPSEQNSYIGRGMIEQQFWDSNAVVADFSRAIDIAPSPLAYFWLGKTLEGKGDYSRAEGAYLAVLRLAPGMKDAQARLEALRGRAQGGSQ